MADAERWALTTDVPGVGRKGDVVIYDPGASNPRYRLCVVSPRGNGDDVEAYREVTRRVQGAIHETVPSGPPRLHVVD